MPDLDFQIEDAEVGEFAATPTIAFKLRLKNLAPTESIHTVALHCQIQLEVTRRTYTNQDKEKLRDLFGQSHRWSQTLRNLLWTNIDVNVRAFKDTILVDLPVPCTFDFNVAATKYFHALGEGNVPLCLMFSGTVFYSQDGGDMQVAPISWEKEARFSLPVKVWHDMMESYYPGGGWIHLRRDVFERLYAYKVRHEIATWEQALESMLEAEESVRS
jgi:Family of unknown function (DUF6084)